MQSMWLCCKVHAIVEESNSTVSNCCATSKPHFDKAVLPRPHFVWQLKAPGLPAMLTLAAVSIMGMWRAANCSWMWVESACFCVTGLYKLPCIKRVTQNVQYMPAAASRTPQGIRSMFRRSASNESLLQTQIKPTPLHVW